MSDRQCAPWMCPLDERVLEFLDREDWGTAGLIHREMEMMASRRRVYERFKILEEAELVTRLYPDGLLFELTGEGQRYLAGELDAAEHLERPNPRAV